MDWLSTLLGITIGLLLIALRGKPSARSASPLLKPSHPSQDSQLLTAYYAALDLAQFKAGFLARTSHELRSPLNALISSLQMIDAGLCDDPEEEKEYLTMAYDGAVRFIGMLDEVLKVSKLQSGKLDLNLGEVDLALVLQEVYLMTQHLAINRNLKLEIPLIEDEILVQADPLYLQQALTILVSQAIETLPEGAIELKFTDSRNLQIAIHDAPAHWKQTHWQEIQAILTQPDQHLPPIAPQTFREIPQQLSPAFRVLLARELLSLMGIGLAILPENHGDRFNHSEKSIHVMECRFESDR